MLQVSLLHGIAGWDWLASCKWNLLFCRDVALFPPSPTVTTTTAVAAAAAAAAPAAAGVQLQDACPTPALLPTTCRTLHTRAAYLSYSRNSSEMNTINNSHK